MQDVEAWMTSRELPRNLRHDTVAFFCDAWLGQAGQILGITPVRLQPSCAATITAMHQAQICLLAIGIYTFDQNLPDPGLNA